MYVTNSGERIPEQFSEVTIGTYFDIFNYEGVPISFWKVDYTQARKFCQLTCIPFRPDMPVNGSKVGLFKRIDITEEA